MKLPAMPLQELRVVGRLSFKPIKESSGLVRSRAWPDVYWTHNDSGDQARIFPVRIDGSIVRPESVKKGEYAGIQILGAQHIDWEDIALDAEGNIFIGDFGNNWSTRHNLGVYVLKEPDPFNTTAARVRWWLPFEYGGHKQSPPSLSGRNYDAEALFCANGRLYILTKHRWNRNTRLYRFATMTPGRINRLVLLGEFNTYGMVTAADASPDGTRLVLLTYKALWLFERTSSDYDSWLEGKVWWLPIKNGRICEGVCFADDAILISNENRDLLRVPIADLLLVRE